MTKNHYFLIAVFLGTFALAFILTNKGCNRTSSESLLDIHTPVASEEGIELTVDQRIDQALKNIQEGKETQNFELMMQEGVMRLREIEQEDSTNERAIYNLALLSIESGQLEKAKIRAKKLILLQPSNEEYQKLYDDVLRRLEEK